MVQRNQRLQQNLIVKENIVEEHQIHNNMNIHGMAKSTETQPKIRKLQRIYLIIMTTQVGRFIFLYIYIFSDKLPTLMNGSS